MKHVLSVGVTSNVATKHHVNIFRDTGAAMSMIQANCEPDKEGSYTEERAVAAALGTRNPCPIARIYVKSPLYTEYLKVMVTVQPFEVPNI